jgi:hypothetical protein
MEQTTDRSVFGRFRRFVSGRSALVLVLSASPSIFTSCGSKNSEEPVATTETGAAEQPKGARGPSPALSGVNESLKTGAFDDAAARLLELHASGRNFSPREAADYRKAMNEAYTRALEAAERGDARAEAAIRMIRSANAH